MSKSEKPKKKSNLGGRRPGAGRKKGGENQATKDRKIAEKEMKDRIIRSKEALMNSQMNLAQGCQFLFVIETNRYKDKNGKWQESKSKPKIVEDQDIITAYLAGELDNGKDEYYFMTTQKPDNKAIDSLFDRTFGKPKQPLVGGDDDDDPLVINILRNGNNDTV